MQLSAPVFSAAGEVPAGGIHHAQRVLSSLNQQRAVGRFCDAVLNVGGGVVYLAHRSILACFSELFQQSDVPAAPCMEFGLQECPNDGLELLLNFVYTGELKLDSDNLDKVQHAAASLCVPEALALCQQFKESSLDAGSVKRKRGRPRKSSDTSAHCSVKEENLLTETKFESSFESCTTSLCLAAATTTTTTRSGRVVKGPRRLVTDESPTIDFTVKDKMSKRTFNISAEKESDDVFADNPNPDPPTGETESTELQIDVNDSGVSQALEQVEDDDDVGDFEGITEGSDDEYVPVAEPSQSAMSTSSTRRRKTQTKPDTNAAGGAQEEDLKKDSVQCPTCSKSFKSKYYLKVHNRRHTGEKPFSCLKCGKRYFRKENLLLHEIRDCARVQMYSCLTCSSTFNGKDELRLHVVSHTGDMPHKCSTCTEQFMHKKNLTLHMMKVHGFPKPHACPQCPKTFLTRTELRIHEASKHRGEKPFVCEECGHRASSRNGLQMHIKAIHRNERPFVCNLCGHAFSQKNNLKMHQRIHSGEKPYQCHLCGKTFRTQGNGRPSCSATVFSDGSLL